MSSWFSSSEDIDVPIEGEEEEEFVTILSIDGGGMRGVIPAVILGKLESYIQDLEGDEKSRIADYFDYIAGTSTGGILTAFLTMPNRGAAKDIVHFYRKEGKNIFDATKQFRNALRENEGTGSVSDKSEVKADQPETEPSLWDQIKALCSEASEKIYHYTKAAVIAFVFKPKYDSKDLHRVVAKTVGEETKLADIKSNVIMTAFDLKRQSPIIFSSLDPKFRDMRLADLVTGTTAAPCYFRPHEFKANGTEYILIDGGMAANNPTLVAVAEAMKNWKREEKRKTRKKFLILSIGTGDEEPEELIIQDGGPADWFFRPIVDTFMRASLGMVERYTPLLQAYCNIEQDFLRIQEPALRPQDAAMDNTSESNIENLEKIARGLLKAKALCVTAENEQPKERETTNKDELKKLARKLVDEKNRRKTSKKKSEE